MIYRKTIALLLAPLLLHPFDAKADVVFKKKPFKPKSVVVKPFVDHHAKNRSGKSEAPKPKTPVAKWVNGNDYPSRAERGEYGGSIAVWLTVNVAGRASVCEVTKSSGYDDLDRAACWNLRRRARFEPALDYHGKPVTGIYPVSVSFYPPIWEKTVF